MKRVKKQRQPRTPRVKQEVVVHTSGVGRARFTVERFFGGVGDAVAIDAALCALRSGYQLEVRNIHEQTLPVFVILACYSRYYADVELVDDYEQLLRNYQEAITVCAHPDKFMASCICILEPREQFPSIEAFEAIRLPELFSELIHIEE